MNVPFPSQYFVEKHTTQKTEKPPVLYHAFEDQRNIQQQSNNGSHPQQAQYNFQQQPPLTAQYPQGQQQPPLTAQYPQGQQQPPLTAQYPQGQQQPQQWQRNAASATGSPRGLRSPPHSPVAQSYYNKSLPNQPADSILYHDVQLARSHDKSKFLDHPSIPRFFQMYLEEDMAQVPKTVPYISPVTRVTMRPTLQTLPNTRQLADTLALPLGVTFQPFAERELVEVDFASLGNRIIRCRKCSGYINPFTTFCEQGRRWQCILCCQLNDVPNEYYCPLDPQTGLRTDVLQRPELTKCSLDFYPSPEFLRRPPQRPAYLLMLDCSYQAIASGQLSAICRGALAALESMKEEDALYIGVLGFASTVYFFSLAPTLQAPRIIVAPDVVHDVCSVDDNFKFEYIELPCSVNELVVPVKDSYHLLKDLFEKLPAMFATTKDVGCAFGPALAAGISMLGSCGGKIVASIDAMPSIGDGKLKTRFDIAKLSNQPKEYAVCSAANDWYKQLALACSNNNISVDLLVSGARDVDLATVAPLSRFTSGSIYRTTPLNVNGLADQVHRILTRYMAFEAVLRVRTSNGLIVPNFYGHCHVREPDLLALPVGNEDSSYSIQLQISSELKSSFAYIQAAIVYTNRMRERRIRVHTFQFGVSPSLGAVVNSADSIGVTCFLSKMAVDYAVNGPLKQAQQRIMDKLFAALRVAKKHNDGLGVRCGHLALPFSVRFLPQLLHGFFRSASVGLSNAAPIMPDERVAAMSMVMSTPPHGMLPYYTCWSYEVYSPHTPLEQLPVPVFATQMYFRSDGVFLVHIGHSLILWHGRQVDPRVLRVFGLAANEESPNLSEQQLSAEDLIALRGRFDALVWELRRCSQCAFSAPLEVCGQGSTLFEPALTRAMTEDEVRLLPSYTMFLREMWQKLSASAS